MPQAPWSASAVEARAVASLLPYAGNARTHSAEQVAHYYVNFPEYIEARDPAWLVGR